jgi:hypothetical protein
VGSLGEEIDTEIQLLHAWIGKIIAVALNIQEQGF